MNSLYLKGLTHDSDDQSYLVEALKVREATVFLKGHIELSITMLGTKSVIYHTADVATDVALAWPTDVAMTLMWRVVRDVGRLDPHVVFSFQRVGASRSNAPPGGWRMRARVMVTRDSNSSIRPNRRLIRPKRIFQSSIGAVRHSCGARWSHLRQPHPPSSSTLPTEVPFSPIDAEQIANKEVLGLAKVKQSTTFPSSKVWTAALYCSDYLAIAAFSGSSLLEQGRRKRVIDLEGGANGKQVQARERGELQLLCDGVEKGFNIGFPGKHPLVPVSYPFSSIFFYSRPVAPGQNLGEFCVGSAMQSCGWEWSCRDRSALTGVRRPSTITELVAHDLTKGCLSPNPLDREKTSPTFSMEPRQAISTELARATIRIALQVSEAQYRGDRAILTVGCSPQSRYLPRPSASSPPDNRAHPMANLGQIPDLEGLHREIHDMAEQMRIMNENNGRLMQLLTTANPPLPAAPPSLISSDLATLIVWGIVLRISVPNE
ncbi:hypothetical protein Acr_00g0082850 [Actinidia rufa]|uniref:Uncharacterized protein n=1 Tax=Actinidia rufa TaxID=165716 RepID=A0A7J0DV38_9ERIC|nr:hypothetical protein Acr_00g0082850 [Actinidia rufa]